MAYNNIYFVELLVINNKTKFVCVASIICELWRLEKTCVI